MKTFLFVLWLSVFFGNQSNLAQAQDVIPNPFAVPVTYPAIKLTGLSSIGKLPGTHYLTAFYAIGNPDFVGEQSDNIHLFQIYKKVSDLQIKNDVLQLPAAKITWNGIWRPNILVLVVHTEPGFTWKNLSGHQPDLHNGILATGNTNYFSVFSVSVQSLHDLQKDQPGQAVSVSYVPLEDPDGDSGTGH